MPRQVGTWTQAAHAPNFGSKYLMDIRYILVLRQFRTRQLDLTTLDLTGLITRQGLQGTGSLDIHESLSFRITVILSTFFWAWLFLPTKAQRFCFVPNSSSSRTFLAV